MHAAVLREMHKPLEIETIELPNPGPHEARVRIIASGVCHSDLSFQNGTFGSSAPSILGHEGSGIVEEVGSAVTMVKPGDHVILAWQAPCRACTQCLASQPELCTDSVFMSEVMNPKVKSGGELVPSMNGLGTFAEGAVIHEQMLIPIGKQYSFEVAALIGCAVTTGVGASINTAKVGAGETVAVIGCGGVGLSAIQGARLAGARQIIAIDRLPDKLQMGLDSGATHTVGANVDAKEAVLELTNGVGVDHALDCVGITPTIRTTNDVTRPGGTVTIVGIGPVTEQFPLYIGEMLSSKRIKFSMYGGSDVRRDFPRLLELNASGKLDLESLIGKRIRLEQVNDALADVEAGSVARSIINFD